MTPPRCSRLRLSIDSDRDQAFDASQMYQHSQSHSASANRVFIDSEGRPHDPEFMSHIFPSSDAVSNNRRTKKARRLSQTGLIKDDLSDDDMDADDDVLLDPFRNYTAGPPQRRAVQSHYWGSPTTSPAMVPRPSLYPAPTGLYKPYQARRASRFANTPQGGSYSSTSTNPSPPSWQQTAILLGESPESTHVDESSYSPVSDRWSVRKWTRSSPSRPPAMLDEDEDEKTPRRVLKKKRTDILSELNEDEDEQHGISEDLEDVPSCATALKRQWQSFVVSFKLSAHRTKRRILPRREENVSYIREKDPFGLGLGT